MTEYIIISITLLILNFLMLRIAWFGWQYSRKIHNVTIVADLIFFFVFVKILFYYLLPTVMRIVSDYQFVREDHVTLSSLAFLYFIELLSWSIWLTTFISILKKLNVKNKHRLSIEQFVNCNYYESKIILFIICIGFILTRIYILFDIKFNILFEINKAIFYYTGLVAGPFLLVLSRKYFGNLFFIIGLVTTVFALFSLSTRGAIVYSILFIIFLVWFVLRERHSKLLVALSGVFFIALYLSTGGLIYGSYHLNDSGELIVITDISSGKRGNRSSLEEIEWRYGAATRMGTAFIDLYERGESAGINPIKHSLMGFLPRSINPDKPHPSTMYSHDLYSQGMYIIYREIYGYYTYSMVEFPTGAHFYWEFGLAGVLVLSAISGLYIAFCAYFFSKLGIVALPLMVTVFKPWGYVDPKIWVSDIAMQLYQIILPLIFLLFIIRIFNIGYIILKKLGGQRKIIYSKRNTFHTLNT